MYAFHLYLYVLFDFPAFLNKKLRNEWHVNRAVCHSIFSSFYMVMLIRSIVVCGIKFMYLHCFRLNDRAKTETIYLKIQLSVVFQHWCDWIACLQEIHYLLFWFCFFFLFNLCRAGYYRILVSTCISFLLYLQSMCIYKNVVGSKFLCFVFLQCFSQSFVIPVNVKVVDVNDNSPQWVGAPYILSISEVTVPGTR